MAVVMVGGSCSRRAAVTSTAAAAAVGVGSLVDAGTVLVVGLTSPVAAAAAVAAGTGSRRRDATAVLLIGRHLLFRPRLVVMTLVLLIALLLTSTIRRGDAHLLGPVGHLVGEGRRGFARRAHLSGSAAVRIAANAVDASATSTTSALQCSLIALGCGRRRVIGGRVQRR